MASKKLTDIPYIGEKTARELRKRIRGRRSTKTGPVTVGEATQRNTIPITVTVLNSRQQKALYEETGDTTLYSRGDFEDERDTREREPSKFSNRGDFKVPKEEAGAAMEQHLERSPRAQQVDDRRRARVTTDIGLWSSAPGHFDYPGIDTPSRKPRVKQKDRPFVQEDELLRRPWEDDQTNGGTTVAASVETGLEDLVGQKPTDELFDLAEHKRQGHQEAREARRGQGGRRTDTHMDEMMKDYLDDLRVIEDELMDRDAI